MQFVETSVMFTYEFFCVSLWNVSPKIYHFESINEEHVTPMQLLDCSSELNSLI